MVFNATFNNISDMSWRSVLWQGVLDTTLCDKVCQLLAARQWFSLGTSVSSTNKTDLQIIYHQYNITWQWTKKIDLKIHFVLLTLYSVY
jgi:hypothetical protein